MNQNKSKFGARQLTLAAMLTAIVVVLQMLGAFIKFGPFSISLVLVPIVIGAALLGPMVGAWLGLVFAGMVFATGDANAFLTINVTGTILTVVVKGVLAGLCAGFVYSKTAKTNIYLAVILAAITAPVVNTGIFLIGCRLFFWPTIQEWGAGLGFKSAASYAFLGLAGGNFLFELLTNVVLAPVIVRLITLARGKFAK